MKTTAGESLIVVLLVCIGVMGVSFLLPPILFWLWAIRLLAIVLALIGFYLSIIFSRAKNTQALEDITTDDGGLSTIQSGWGIFMAILFFVLTWLYIFMLPPLNLQLLAYFF